MLILLTQPTDPWVARTSVPRGEIISGWELICIKPKDPLPPPEVAATPDWSAYGPLTLSMELSVLIDEFWDRQLTKKNVWPGCYRCWKFLCNKDPMKWKDSRIRWYGRYIRLQSHLHLPCAVRVRSRRNWTVCLLKTTKSSWNVTVNVWQVSLKIAGLHLDPGPEGT